MEKIYTLELTKAELFLILNILDKSIVLYAVMENTKQEVCDSLASKIVKAGENAQSI